MKASPKFGWTLVTMFALAMFGSSLASADDVDTSSATCPVSGKDVNSEKSASHHGGKVFFCCGNCLKAYAKNPDNFATKANQQLVVTGQALQSGCPISGNKTKADTATKIGGIDISFCCKGCLGRVNKSSGDDQLELVFGPDPFEKGFTVGDQKE
ncbi:MAG: hypothetical protein N2C12_01800 [Planctomycetales bacterium]